MPDTSTAWEDLTLEGDALVGINSSDFSSYNDTTIAADQDQLKASKKTLRAQIMGTCAQVAALFADRESFFDAIGTLAATDADPLYDDIQHLLALGFAYHWYGGEMLSDVDRMYTLRKEVMAELKQAVKGLCPTLAMELDVGDGVQGAPTTKGKTLSLHSYTAGRKNVYRKL